MRPKIIFSNVTKGFNIYKKQSDKLLEIISLKKKRESFSAVRDLSFEIFEGESIGIVGLNGSGKSTMSNLLAQVIPPTSGTIEINGETSLIAISAGLNNSLSGVENIELKCLMHGMKKSEIEKLKPEIIEFADLGKFINQPVKNYSSGMKSKLGFAISVHTNPDILIIDEALSVGDQTFYQKCINKMNQFREQGKTIVFISHSLSQVEGFCDRVLWMNFGRIEKFGETKEVLADYRDFINWFNKLTDEQKKIYRSEMLAEQYKETKADIDSKKCLKKKAKRSSGASFVIQVCLLSCAVFASAGFMFNNNPFEKMATVWHGMVKQETGVESVSEERIEINGKGIVMADQSQLYTDQELTKQYEQAAFLDEVLVNEQIDHLYNVTVDGVSCYAQKEDILLIDEDVPEANHKLESFLPLFPQEFANAYLYFFSFINKDADVIKASIKEMPVETLNRLNYANSSAKFNLNEENIAQSITISNINTASTDFDVLINSALSVESQYYYFDTEEFTILMDALSGEITFSARSN